MRPDEPSRCSNGSACHGSAANDVHGIMRAAEGRPGDEKEIQGNEKEAQDTDRPKSPNKMALAV